MKKLSSTEAELKNSFAYKKACFKNTIEHLRWSFSVKKVNG